MLHTGISLAIAKQFLAEGARVVITSNNPDSIARTQAELGPDVLEYLTAYESGGVPPTPRPPQRCRRSGVQGL